MYIPDRCSNPNFERVHGVGFEILPTDSEGREEWEILNKHRARNELLTKLWEDKDKNESDPFSTYYEQIKRDAAFKREHIELKNRMTQFFESDLTKSYVKCALCIAAYVTILFALLPSKAALAAVSLTCLCVGVTIYKFCKEEIPINGPPPPPAGNGPLSPRADNEPHSPRAHRAN